MSESSKFAFSVAEITGAAQMAAAQLDISFRLSFSRILGNA